MARLKIPFKFISISPKLKRWLWPLLALLLVVSAGAVYWFIIREAWVNQPVMLRILKGTAETSTSQQSKFTGAADKVWLAEGNSLKTQEGSLAVLQYFDGSAVKIEGAASVRLSRTRSLRGQPLDAARSIRLEVIRGKVTVQAAMQANPGSVFEVDTPSSAGVVQGTVFEVEADPTRGDVWEAGGGTVRVAAIVAGNDKNAVVVLLPLDAGKALAIPPLPGEWLEDPDDMKGLISLARNVAVMSVKEGSSVVKVRGVSLLESNPETGTAVFKVEMEFQPASATGNAIGFSHIYTTVGDSMLARLAPGLIFDKRSPVKAMFMPSLDAPWAKPAQKIERKKPPTYSFSINNIDRPLGVAVDPAGQRIAVTESSGAHLTRVFDETGNELMVLSPPGTAPGDRNPVYAAIDWTGNIYVSDRRRHTIDMYDTNGAYLGVFQPTNNSSAYWSPLGLAFDSSGNLYVTDVSDGMHRVIVFDSSGELKLAFGKEGNGSSEFAFPNGIAVDGEGRMFVADSSNFRVQAFDDKGQLMGVFSGVGFPRGMGIEGNYLYVADTFESIVRVFIIANGLQPVFTFGTEGMGDGQFNFPNGLAVDAAGRIYITDRENNRVQVWGY